MISATLVLSITSFVILLSRRANCLYRFNAMFLDMFGVNQEQPSWLRWLATSVLGTTTASLLMVLLINVADALIQLTLPSGIGLDSTAGPLLIGLVLLFGTLLVCATVVVLTSPIASPIALAILTALHLFAYRLTNPFSLTITAVFFCCILIGAVCTFISLYLIFRRYLLAALLRMRRKN
jgi:hypothetical protein